MVVSEYYILVFMNEYTFYISAHFRDALFKIMVPTFPFQSPVFKTFKLMIEIFARLKLSCVISLGKIVFNKFINRNLVNSFIFLTI